jgi:putative membrane protein
MLRLTLAFLHLLALGIGLGAIWTRARSLATQPLTVSDVRRALVSDNWWAFAGALWITTGLWRLLAGTEKATSYYTHNHVFFAKMAFLVILLVMEAFAVMAMVRWRSGMKKLGDAWQPDIGGATRVRIISYAEIVLVLAMVVAAVSMARGYGYVGAG